MLDQSWSSLGIYMVLGGGGEITRFDRVQGCYKNVLLAVRPWINIFKLMLLRISRVVLRRTCGAENNALSTHLVNATVVASRGNCDRREPIIVYI